MPISVCGHLLNKSTECHSNRLIWIQRERKSVNQPFDLAESHQISQSDVRVEAFPMQSQAT
jgi:hypothetical protein